jgi:ABC-2 type transport system permease protein
MSTNPTKRTFSMARARTVCRTDLRQLIQAKDFWVPMAVMGAIFYVVIPFLLLGSLSALGNAGGGSVSKVGQIVNVLPKATQSAIPAKLPSGKTVTDLARASYALAVYLFASLAVVVPITVGNAVAASAIVGERERGTGEFLAHSPAHESEIYAGKLVASFLPGYLSTLIGFGAYALLVNLIVGPQIGGWFFPTKTWWVLMLWVIPAFIAMTLSIVVRVSGRVSSTTAAHQISGLVSIPAVVVSYGLSSQGLAKGIGVTFAAGAILWAMAVMSLARGMKGLRRWRLLGVAMDA